MGLADLVDLECATMPPQKEKETPKLFLVYPIFRLALQELNLKKNLALLDI